jgi:mRNA-degrading endonuclease YafQ of YafQ-DinJ toxin-antitoxin module
MNPNEIWPAQHDWLLQMTWQLIFTEQYNRRAAKFLKRNPAIESHYAKALELLEHNPYHPSLRLHALSGRLSGL